MKKIDFVWAKPTTQSWSGIEMVLYVNDKRVGQVSKASGSGGYNAVVLGKKEPGYNLNVGQAKSRVEEGFTDWIKSIVEDD